MYENVITLRMAGIDWVVESTNPVKLTVDHTGEWLENATKFKTDEVLEFLETMEMQCKIEDLEMVIHYVDYLDPDPDGLECRIINSVGVEDFKEDNSSDS